LQIDHQRYYQKEQKWGSKGACSRSCDLFFRIWDSLKAKFLDPLYISGMAEAMNFKLGVQTDHYEYYQKVQKIGDKRAWAR